MNEEVLQAYHLLTKYQEWVAISVFIMTVRTILFLISFDDGLKYAFKVLINMSGRITYFLILFFTIIYAFSGFSFTYYGSEVSSFKKFGSAFLYNFGMVIGDHEELDQMKEKN